MRVLKTKLAEWMVENNEDCGRDTYFELGLTANESFHKFMKDYSKDELVSLIYDFSDEGQSYIDELT